MALQKLIVLVSLGGILLLSSSGALARDPVTGDSGTGNPGAKDPLKVCVSIPPQAYFVEQIGRDRVAVQVMVSPGASPAAYEPGPGQMRSLSSTRIYFAVGVPFEGAWLNKIAAANPAMTIVHTDQGIRKLAMADHIDREHDRGTLRSHRSKAPGPKKHFPGKEPGLQGPPTGNPDPHIWLSPGLVLKQARAILQALIQEDPESRDFYETNYHSFAHRISTLDSEFKELFQGDQGKKFMVFHPSWGYFAKDYGLIQVPVELEGKNPKPAQLVRLITLAREKKIRVIFIQPQFSDKSARLIAREIKGRVVKADPLARDWLSNLRQVARAFKEVIQ